MNSGWFDATEPFRTTWNARLVGEVHMTSVRSLFEPRGTLRTRLVGNVHISSVWFDATEPFR